MTKFTIEITPKQMIKTLEIDGKTFSETWEHIEGGGDQTVGLGIDRQLEQAKIEVEDMLIDALDSEDLFDIWDAVDYNSI